MRKWYHHFDLPFDPIFERKNAQLRRLYHRGVQSHLFKYRDCNLYKKCGKSLREIYCCNDMHYVLEIARSSRMKKLESIIDYVNTRDQRRYHRKSEDMWGFWYPE